jgi:hypothetical protein
LINDAREKPLMLPVKKKISKKASYDSSKDAFGYMANLDIEMEDRVQPFDDNDQDTTWFDERFIRNLTRYNPEYGNPMSKENEIYYWFKDPRLEISLWDDYMNERPGLRTTPFQKAASSGGWTKKLIEILRTTIKSILTGKIRGTRFVCDLATAPLIGKFYENDLDLKVKNFQLNKGLMAVWVSSAKIPGSAICLAEDYVSGKADDDRNRQIFEYITSIDKIRADAISIMLATVGKAARDAAIDAMWVVGDLPLITAINGDKGDIRTVDFCACDPDVCLKIGEIICKKLKVPSYFNDELGMLVMSWRCVTFRFRGYYSPEAITGMLASTNIDPTPINIDLYSRGITPLMLAMDVVTEDIIDHTGQAMPDIEAKVVRSVIAPAKALSFNPLFVFDAIFVASKCKFVIDSEFADAAKEAESTDDVMASAWPVIRAIGKGKTTSVAEEYGMENLVKTVMEGKYANSN